MIAEVIVHEASREGATIEIVWKGGARQSVTVLRPRGVDAAVKARTLEGDSSTAIAERLNAAGVVTASGRPVSPNVIHGKQGQLGLRLKDERQWARQIIRDALLANTPRPELIRHLQHHAPRLGPWDPQRLSEAIRQLRRGVANLEPLPPTLPADEEKTRILALTDQGLAAGKNWHDIATDLTASGLRPPRGTTFTPVQVRLLYLRARGLRSFKLRPARSANGGLDA